MLGHLDGPQTTFVPGEAVEFVIEITAHHMGHFEFGLCREQISYDAEDPQECLDELELKRVHPRSDCKPNDDRGDCQPLREQQEHRWYLPPGTDTKKMRFQIPAATAVEWYSTVFAEGFNDRVSENFYIECFNSTSGRYLPMGNALSAVNIGMWYDENSREHKYRGSGCFWMQTSSWPGRPCKPCIVSRRTAM